MRISKRLRVISDFIPDNSFILDVGCDHALLDIYVVLNKKNVKAIASDINEGPIKGAIANVNKYNVSDRVNVVLGSGLSTYEKGIDTIVLSGLGTNTIIDILKDDISVLNSIDRLIVSSNNDYHNLRKKISDFGFYIKDEKMVIDRNKYYPVILFEKGKSNYKSFELKYGPVLLNKKDDEFINYMIFKRSKLIEIYKSLSNRYLFKKIKLRNEVKKINDYLK